MKKGKQLAALLAAVTASTGIAAMPQHEETQFFAETTAAPAAHAVSAEYADAGQTVVSGAEYRIMVRLSGKFITAAEDGNVQQWEALGTAAQRWKIVKQDGYCAILSAENPSLALTVEGGDNTNGNNIALSSFTGSDAQLFSLIKTDDAFCIRAKCSRSAALDVYDISYENGANIDQWDYWGGEGQKFYIQPADGTLTFLRGDLDFNGKLNAADLTLLKRGLLSGFDPVCAYIADCGDTESAGDTPTVNAEDARALCDYLLRGRDGFRTDTVQVPAADAEPTAYLFAYFLGNNPDQERLSYAVSRDGYHFSALNGGRAVWQSSVGTKCLRDPYIFKGEDGLWHLLATDMKSSLGWNSNRDLISAKSTDLIHWFDESQIKIANQYPNMMNCDRAWAPQAIYDPEKGSYMIYFAARVPGTDDRTIMYYAYSRDLMKLDTAPALLLAPSSGHDAIDSDIIFENGKYYMYYKDETTKGIFLAEAAHASGPYKEIHKISEGSLGVEGPNIYKLNGEKKWLLMSDAYGNGYYVMQETNDLENFRTVSRADYSFDFTPRHGYVIPITGAQYDALVSAFPSAGLHTYNTVVDQPAVHVQTGGTVSLPETVTARYSDGGRMELPVTWDAAALAKIDTSQPGTYTVTGSVQGSDYKDPFIMQRADPFVTDGGDGYYYFTASYPAFGSVNDGYDRIILRRSNTVAGLAGAEEKTVWKAHGSGIMAKHIWAPEMHRIGGKWYIFFAAGASSDIWAIRPYVLECDGDPYTGTWTERGQMQAASGDTSSFRSFSLDMTYFEQNGHHYVIWAEIKGDSSLFMAEIDPAAPWKLISQPILLTKPEYDWEMVNHRVNEGAAVLKANGIIYVFFSASGTGSEYCVGRMEADADANLMDTASWTKQKSPVLSTADLFGEKGPGHNSFITDESGNLLIVYHARPEAHDRKECGTYASDPLYDPCRHTHIRQVYFDVDGVPQINLRQDEFLSDGSRTVTATVQVG